MIFERGNVSFLSRQFLDRLDVTQLNGNSRTVSGVILWTMCVTQSSMDIVTEKWRFSTFDHRNPFESKKILLI